MISILKKPLVIILIAIVVFGAALIVVFKFRKSPPAPVPVEVIEVPKTKHEVIGKSVEGRDLEAYTYGTGGTHLLFVGGIHGGYEWNSVVLAEEFIKYLDQNPNFVPEGISITVVPNANPDGVYKVVGKVGSFSATDVPVVTKELSASGRFNSNGVDLNRNFDCNWQPNSTWQSKTVSAGSVAFSEPEARAIRDLVMKIKPASVVFWHSQANAVYASECNNGILPITLDVMNTYAKAAGYPSVNSFDSYKVTGDAEGWLASVNIPAITVELKTHETVEWDKNLAGITALVGYFSNAR